MAITRMAFGQLAVFFSDLPSPRSRLSVGVADPGLFIAKASVSLRIGLAGILGDSYLRELNRRYVKIRNLQLSGYDFIGGEMAALTKPE